MAKRLSLMSASSSASAAHSTFQKTTEAPQIYSFRSKISLQPLNSTPLSAKHEPVVASESRAAKLGRVVETHILRRWGEHFIDKITAPKIDAWVRWLTADYGPETIRHRVGLF